jgi:hypothetical protein
MEAIFALKTSVNIYETSTIVKLLKDVYYVFRIKLLGREADRSLPLSAEEKKGGAIPPLPRMSPWRNA